MTHPLMDERLSAWLDGDLSPEEERALEDELARDPHLADAAARLREARDVFRRHAPAAAPAGFVDRVLEATAQEPPAVRPWRLPTEAVLLAAAAALVLWSIAPREPPATVATVATAVAPERAGLGVPTMLAPTGWRFEGSASPVALQAAAEAAGASWSAAEGGVTLTLPADRLSELHLALETLGALHELDAPRPVQGTVTVTLQLE